MYKKNDVDIEQNLNLDFLENEKYCNICYLNQNKIIICNKCEYEMCDNCYQLYINKYKYTNCPHCRETIIKDVELDQDNYNSIFSKNKLLLKLLLILLFPIYILLCTYIKKGKNFDYITLDLLIGLLFVSSICICFFRHF